MVSKETIELIGKATALAVFVFSVFTYAYNLHVKRETDRYERALAIIDGYVEGGVLALETELDSRLLYYSSQVDLNDPAALRDEAFDAVAKETLFGWTDGRQVAEPFLPKLLSIVEYYERVEFCVSAGICDESVAAGYFCPKARAFVARHTRLVAYLADYSRREGRFADVDRLVSRCANG